MDSSAFNHIGDAMDFGLKLLLGLLIAVPVLILIIIYLLVS